MLGCALAAPGLTADDRTRIGALLAAPDASRDLQGAASVAAGLVALGLPVPQVRQNSDTHTHLCHLRSHILPLARTHNLPHFTAPRVPASLPRAQMDR
jgi:hypothetical protein